MAEVQAYGSALPIASIRSAYVGAMGAIEKFGAPVVDLAVRIAVGMVFFRSGMQKLQDWDSTIFLFQEEYKVPLLPPDLAALLGTACELAMPALLIAGLAARLAALPLIAMTLVIQFVLGAANPAYDSVEHTYWFLLLAMIVVRGPGMLSIDYLIDRRIR